MREKIERVHLIAACGVGMAPLAVMLKEKGLQVTGCDRAAFPPMSDVLRAAGIELASGFSPEHLSPQPDLTVVGNAIPASNEEAREVERLGIRRWSFPETVSRLFLDDRQSLVVTGTHGKTTTTGLLARSLEVAGLDPGYLVGGLVRDLGQFARAGSGRPFVIEGDEYDSAYFDKRPKFLHYRPSAAIVSSIEFDHADIYRDLEHVRQAFRELAELLPQGAPLVGCGDCGNLRSTLRGVGRGRLIEYGYGLSSEWEWHAALREEDEAGLRFDVFRRGRKEDRLVLRLCGRMNVLNALSVYVLCRELGVDRRAVAETLLSFRGAARRQEVVGERGGVLVVDDFAHHPTAVAATLDALRGRYPQRRLCAVFEPRSNTSRRAVFQDDYATALARADIAVVSAVYRKENDPLSEEQMLSVPRLLESLRAAGLKAWSADGPEEILERLPRELGAGDLVVCMSNGAFGGLPRRLLDALD